MNTRTITVPLMIGVFALGTYGCSKVDEQSIEEVKQDIPRITGTVVEEKYIPTPSRRSYDSTYVFKLSTPRGMYTINVESKNGVSKESVDFHIDEGDRVAIRDDRWYMFKNQPLNSILNVPADYVIKR
ncbi:hypothetical protein GOV11_00495 [Candidatus Woesearchaeota archaeon]|nr:hypothetical protein [Candidatus Woesearchaeota archaeon]